MTFLSSAGHSSVRAPHAKWHHTLSFISDHSKRGRAMRLRVVSTLLFAATAAFGSQAATAAPVKNIVLVHGAFVGGSGWRPVYDILTRDGYKVTLVQEPLTSFADDVAATKRILDRQNGPAILVGHSYGGAIITEAG